jgi:hypothetical protein
LPARRHLVEQGAKAEEVGAGVQFFTSRLFGRHVSHRTHRHARAGEVFRIDGGGERILKRRSMSTARFHNSWSLQLGQTEI